VKAAGILGALAFALAAPAAPLWAQNLTPRVSAGIRGLLKYAVEPSISMPVWVSRKDDPPAGYVRNPVVWTGPLNLTGKAVWNSHTGSYGTTAISPRHVVYAYHVNGLYPAGTVVRFIAGRSDAVERIVVSSARIGDTDLALSTLDSPLPVTIHWFKVMPKHWFFQCARGISCMVMDGNTQSVAIKDIDGFGNGIFATAAPADPLFRTFTRELRLGDSGSPMFILVGGELVLDGIYHTARGGVEVSSYVPELDAAMKAGGFQVTVADLNTIALP
jgi:hypothetical protein